ncbi:MAG: response regulator [Anaerolineales bacterium]|nr:MAG: response regulator [Anaerolineales bacterium]
MNAPVKVMIVEDEAIVALDLEQHLLDLGYAVSAIVASGEAAIETATRDAPDIILMDIQLQTEMDGITAAKNIKAGRPVSVIYLTAAADQATLYRARETEPHGYLVKPFSAETLRTTIDMASYKFQSERKLIAYTNELEKQKTMLELLHLLLKMVVQDNSLEDLMRMACPGLINVLHLPYAFSIALGHSPSDTIVFEYVSEDSNITTTDLTPESYQTCQKYFTPDKPWIIQSIPPDHCLDVLVRYKTNHFHYPLFILPLVVGGDVVGVIGLGVHHTEEISVNAIRAAWSVVSEIVSALESNGASGAQQQITDVLFYRNIAIVITDNVGAVEYINPAFEKYTGCMLQEMEGHLLLSLPCLGSDVDNVKLDPLKCAISQSASWHGSLDTISKKGVVMPTEVALWPVVETAHGVNSGDTNTLNPIDVPYITHFVLLFQTHNSTPDYGEGNA